MVFAPPLLVFFDQHGPFSLYDQLALRMDDHASKCMVCLGSPCWVPPFAGGMITMTIKTLVTGACLIMTTATAGSAATFTVDGDEYDVSTITGSFDDNVSLLESQVFFGDEDLALEFASEVGDLLGIFNFGFLGPLFAFDNGLPDSTGFHAPFDSSLSSAILTETANSNITDLTWAVVYPVAAVPLPAGGLLLLSAFGGVAALKRRKKRAA